MYIIPIIIAGAIVALAIYCRLLSSRIRRMSNRIDDVEDRTTFVEDDGR